jgi:hypothetical protein
MSYGKNRMSFELYFAPGANFNISSRRRPYARVADGLFKDLGWSIAQIIAPDAVEQRTVPSFFKT